MFSRQRRNLLWPAKRSRWKTSIWTRVRKIANSSMEVTIPTQPKTKAWAKNLWNSTRASKIQKTRKISESRLRPQIKYIKLKFSRNCKFQARESGLRPQGWRRLAFTSSESLHRISNLTIAWSSLVTNSGNVLNTPVKITKTKDSKIHWVTTHRFKIQVRKRSKIRGRLINSQAVGILIIISWWWVAPTTSPLTSNKVAAGILMPPKSRKI